MNLYESLNVKSSISLGMENAGLDLSFFLSICQQQTNMACVLLLCDTWAAVGGRCNVFIHSLVSSQTGTEFHYSGIKWNQFCPLRTLSLWVLVKCKECWPCIYVVLVSFLSFFSFSCISSQCLKYTDTSDHIHFLDMKSFHSIDVKRDHEQLMLDLPK